MQLTNKVALITGAGSGIGKAAAIEFVQAGAKVAVLGHTKDEIEQTAREIGNDTLALTADIADPMQVERAIAATVKTFGKLDIVFANAGINGVQAPVDELQPAEWNRTITNNLTGTFLTIHYAVPHLKKAGGGSILITSSINGTRYFSNSGATAYAVSKAGQVALMQMLAVELGPSHIRVNAICPGAIETDISDNTEKRNVDKIQIKVEKSREIPLTRAPGTAKQVAQLALFLASDASSHITGTPVWIDGAQSLL